MSTTTKALEYREIWCELVDDTDGKRAEGRGLIFHGADFDRAEIENVIRREYGDNVHRIVMEVQHLTFRPRIKWCDRVDFSGCDSNGEWHAHWFGAQHNPAANGACCYTLALPVYATEESR